MTASEPDTRDPAAAKATSSPPFRIEPIPYTNYPGELLREHAPGGMHGLRMARPVPRLQLRTGPAAHPLRPERPRAVPGSRSGAGGAS